MNAYPSLFQPLRVKHLEFKNRFFSAPNANAYVQDGYPNDYYIEYMAEKARGGAAMVVISEVPVAEGGAHLGHLRLDPQNRMMVAELAEAIHQYGAVCSVELTHGGQAADPAFNRPECGLISSMASVRPDGAVVSQMTAQDISNMAEQFARAAVFFQGCGVDMCLIHAGHHWLLNQFLSPVFNQRTDEYGGSLENRMRFPIMVFQKVREAVGPDFVIDVRLSVGDFSNQGNSIDDSLYFLQQIRPYINMVHVTAGADWSSATLVQSTTFQPKGSIVYLAQIVKEKFPDLVVVAHGGILDPDLAEEIIASGKADAVASARAIIADPYLPRKAQLGQTENIRPCLRCLDCLCGSLATGVQRCSVNPTAYKENRLNRWRPTRVKHDLLVVGGGPAGMEAAIQAFDRGHHVTVMEQESELGGWLRFTDNDTVKHDLREYKDYLIRQVSRREINVLLNTRADKSTVGQVAPDTIFVAAGSVPVRPPIIGIEHAAHASQVYFGLKPGRQVVLIGGGLVGCEAAIHLANLGCSVTILETGSEFARDANFMHRDGLLRAFAARDITVCTGTRCDVIQENGVWSVSSDGDMRFLAADTILYAVGMKPRTDIVDAMRPLAPVVVPIGDCCRPAKVSQAIHSAYGAAVALGDL